MATLEDVDLTELFPKSEVMKVAEEEEEEPMFLTPREVAGFFGVDTKTVSRWANAGKLDGKVRMIRTPGNHRRFRTEDVKKLLEEYDA